MNLLSVKNLTVDFTIENRRAPAVRGLALDIAPKEIVCLVGESGCGKSVASMAIMGLLESPPAIIRADKIALNGTDLLRCSSEKRRSFRGKVMAMIFQEPMTSLNPVYTIGDQISEQLLTHFPDAGEEALERAIAALREVRITDPEKIIHCYPHELSGGMKQRVMIAMALICRPELLIADEPTTALDVTVQSQILDLLREIRETHAMGMLFITHDLSVVAELADRVCVMYAGKIVEQAAAEKFFAQPRHPYAAALLECLPKLHGEKKRLVNIAGTVPSPLALPDGCKFAPRCPQNKGLCGAVEPELREVAAGHFCACHYSYIGKFTARRQILPLSRTEN